MELIFQLGNYNPAAKKKIAFLFNPRLLCNMALLHSQLTSYTPQENALQVLVKVIFSNVQSGQFIDSSTIDQHNTANELVFLSVLGNKL